MLKSFPILIALYISSIPATACEFIENKIICADEKLNIMDMSLQEVKYTDSAKAAIKYGISHSCKQDLGCVQETLAYQLRMNGNIIKNYNIAMDSSSIDCAKIYTLYPGHPEVVVNIQNKLSLGSLNDDVFKSDKQLVYIIENMKTTDKNQCQDTKSLKLTQIKSLN